MRTRPTLRFPRVDPTAARRCSRSAVGIVLAALCAPAPGVAGPGSPFGPDDTGCAPVTSVHLRCESALARSLSGLCARATRCERQQVDRSFRILHSRFGSVPPRRFDEEGCIRSQAKAPFDEALRNLERTGGCPPAALLNARALGSRLVADESTSGSLDALNEVIYCDPASGTPIDSAASASSGGGGWVPGTRDDLRCSDGVGQNLARLVRDVTGCHVSFAHAAFGKRAGAFDEDMCEARARARYTRAARKLSVRARCPRCLDLGTQVALGDAAIARADQESGRIFICAESTTSTTTTSTTTTSPSATTHPPTTTTQPTVTTTTGARPTSTSTTQRYTTTTRTTTSTTLTHGTTTTSAPPAVFVIVMENKNWSDIRRNASAPYINNTLLPMASHAEQYYNPPNLHPSLPNYLWLEAGTNFGVLDDGDPSSDHQSSQHLVDLLEAAGLSWRAYEEGISGTDCPLTDVGSYSVHHDPFVYFDDVTQGNDLRAARCIAHVRPYSELASDLSNNTVARYNFITPNQCHNMHDSCAPLNDKVKQGDAWLSTEVPRILASQAFARNGVLFITWDEAKPGDGPIGMIVLSPLARGAGYANAIHYTHSSTLRTVEEIFGVSPLLNDAANATDLADLFATFP